MYRKHLSQKASPSIRSTPINKEIPKSPSYGSLSGVVQRVQQDPNSMSEDERQQLESAIGTRSTKEILAGKQTQWAPEFQGISAQLWGNSGQAVAPIQAKLTIGEVGDKYEQEADRVAKDVVQQIHAPQTNPPAILQRQEIEDEELQRKESPQIVQRREVIAGGEVFTNLDTAINSARGGGQPLDVGLQNSMGQAMGADFSGVRVHTDAQADKLNRSIQAKAFTTGQDVFFRQGEYQPGSRGGQELLAHELTHVVQQTGKGLSGSSLQKSLYRGHSEVNIIQRAFHPVTTTSNAQLRNNDDGETQVGDRIGAGSEIVVDRTQIQLETHRFRSDTKWVKAVNVTGLNWDWENDSEKNTYIKDVYLGENKKYPHKEKTDTYKPEHRKYSGATYQLMWNEKTGEYIEIEDSLTTPDAKVAYHKGKYKHITNSGDIAELDSEEKFQIDTNALEENLFNRVEIVLNKAAIKVLWNKQLATTHNITKVMYEENGSKALRFTFGSQRSGQAFIAWYKWVTNPDGPFRRIAQGAEFVVNSLEHWRKWLFPPNGIGVTITSIKLTGSDLHEHGLGAMFVKFKKPLGGNTDYNAAGEHEVVIKPEVRDLEHSLFGTQQTSLANVINDLVGLDPASAISTYKQAVAPSIGTLCEKVVGTQAKNITETRDVTQAMKEALLFVLVTGLTDLHGENVFWDDQGKPYFIDADNALKLKYMQKNMPLQSGFSAFSYEPQQTVNAVMKNSIGYETKIMQALKEPSSWTQVLLLNKVKAAFTGKTGRVVPIETAKWAYWLQNGYIITANEGTQSDVPAEKGKAQDTRWKFCKFRAQLVPYGKEKDTEIKAGGLKEEAGEGVSGNGNFQEAVEAQQIFADFKVGQIPFYTYEYSTGQVKHNGQLVWTGDSIVMRMKDLCEMFPNQLTVL